MLEVFVVDHSAEGRAEVVQQINQFLSEASSTDGYVPQIRIKPVRAEELSFHSAPDICILGSGLLHDDVQQIVRLKRHLPSTPVLVWHRATSPALSLVEHLARIGVEDVITPSTTGTTFLQKLVFLQRKTRQDQGGKLIVVDSGKGGLGVTSIVASLGEMLAENGKKTALVDLDFESQDLSRFLQAKPFFNENLHLLLENNRPVTQESVEETFVPVHGHEESLYCVAPPPDSDDLLDSKSRASRPFLQFLEVLDELFDYVIIDPGCARGALLRTVYRAADHYIFTLQNDPACLFSSVHRLEKVRGYLSPGARISILENNSSAEGLSSTLLRQEFSRAARLKKEDWCTTAVPHSSEASRWAGSGASMFAFFGAQALKAYEEVAEHVGLLTPQKRAVTHAHFFAPLMNIKTIISKMKKRERPKLLPFHPGQSSANEPKPSAPISLVPNTEHREPQSIPERKEAFAWKQENFDPRQFVSHPEVQKKQRVS